MSRMPRLAPALILATFAVAGCGSSGNSNTATTSQAFVAQADPICKQVSVERTAANTALNKVGSSKTKQLAVLARVAPAVASEEQQAVVKLQALQPPSSLTSNWHILLTGMQALAQDTSQIASDAKANKLEEIEAITKSGRKVREKLTAIATRDGFAYCGRTS